MTEQGKEYLLCALRAASLRAKMWDNEITALGCAVKANLISPTQAVLWLKEIGGLDWLGTIPADAIMTDGVGEPEKAAGGKKP